MTGRRLVLDSGHPSAFSQEELSELQDTLEGLDVLVFRELRESIPSGINEVNLLALRLLDQFSGELVAAVVGQESHG